ncbi:MAG: hypothetical protein C7B45_04855 [Sulfobacillus acidophilus]|uniref:Uncharacterized protein n=1 Tax=Sulfobacillus acidophilus TaxID=53633 RepID=A0A2T2WL25_9FIRM|nr:MAG: hypothetical protein C7B45_04855 [Sulfobacillus acidophilus]
MTAPHQDATEDRARATVGNGARKFEGTRVTMVHLSVGVRFGNRDDGSCALQAMVVVLDVQAWSPRE